MQLTNTISVARSVRWVLALLAIVAIVVAAYLWAQQVKMESAWRYNSNLPTFHKVTEGNLDKFYVPVNRKFEVVTDKGAIVGKWTRHPVGNGELVHGSQLTGTSPDRYRFDGSGEPLPKGTYAYHLNVPSQIMGKVSHNDYLSLAMVDQAGEQLIVLCDKVRILEKTEGGFYLGLTMDQIAAMEKLKAEVAAKGKPEGAEEGEGEDGDEIQPETTSTLFDGPVQLMWTITQGSNPDLPPLAVYRMELTEDTLSLGEAQ